MVRNRYSWSVAVLLFTAVPLHGATQVVTADRPHSIVVGRNSSAARTPAVAQRPPVVPPPAPAVPQRPSDPNIDLLSAPDHVAYHQSVRTCEVPATNPAAAVWHLYSAIERGDAYGLAGRLTDDYRFTSNDPGFLASWPDGFDRAGELNFVMQLNKSARDVAISYEGLSIDPPTTAFRAAPGTYRAHVTGASIRIVDASGNVVASNPSEHWIEVVCVQASPESRVSTCFVRRWTEQAVIPIAMTQPAVDTTEYRAAIAHDAPDPDKPDALDLRVVSHGGSGVPFIALAIPLPGPVKFEMFDIAGRRVDSRQFDVMPRGTHTIWIPAQLPSGVYWARVRQAGATRSARVLVVR